MKIQMVDLILFTSGLLAHLFMRRCLDIQAWFLNEKGEASTEELKFNDAQQKHIDGLIAAKAKDYHTKLEGVNNELSELRKFKIEFEKSQETKNQEELIRQKKYDEAEGNLKKQINDLSTKLTEKDNALRERDINYALSTEISNQNGFTEEATALLRKNTFVDANGQVLIKGKDNNGVDTNFSVAEGVKKFLTERPYLVKSNHKSGAGSGNGADNGSGAGNGQGEDLATLNAQLVEAKRAGNHKEVARIKTAISAGMAKRGVKRN